MFTSIWLHGWLNIYLPPLNFGTWSKILANIDWYGTNSEKVFVAVMGYFRYNHLRVTTKIYCEQGSKMRLWCKGWKRFSPIQPVFFWGKKQAVFIHLKGRFLMALMSSIYCWWFRRLANQLRFGSLSHYFQGFMHRRWLAGFLNHEQYVRLRFKKKVCRENWGFRSL